MILLSTVNNMLCYNMFVIMHVQFYLYIVEAEFNLKMTLPRSKVWDDFGAIF